MCGTQEVLRDRRDLPTVANSNRAIVSVRVIVRGLLVVLETLHKRKEVCEVEFRTACTVLYMKANALTISSPAFGLEIICR